jgi:hypothetical protein
MRRNLVKEKESIPFAPALVESMGLLGYSFKMAVVDLTDNSALSANVKHIGRPMFLGANPILSILDLEFGILPATLEEVMRYGSTNQLNIRNQNELGRFGLGMKSASLSQYRKLTVAGKRDNLLSAFSWKCDKIIETDKWSLMELGEVVTVGI